MQVKKELKQVSEGIGNFIRTWLTNKEDFQSRSFYGETFSLALLEEVDILDFSTKDKLINAYKNIDKNDSQFHWEFNNYALLNYVKNSEDEDVKKLIYPIRFKNTPVTNWTLLRSNARLLANHDVDKAVKEAIEKIQKYQLESGLILDQKHDKSFQYHCFSAAMIAELYEHTGYKIFYNSFLLAVDFIRKLLLSNGESTYIGRGQKQSFGMGALVYILSLAYKYTLNQSILVDINKVTKLLLRYQNKDGSFPLVLNGVNQPIPNKVNLQNPAYLGWYPYNNYFDYLPFMGYFVAKAAKTLINLELKEVEQREKVNFRDEDFIKVNKEYEAVVSRTGGLWTNDMPIPYIIYKEKNVTPCYGGEQFQNSLYTQKGLPLPYCKLLGKSIRWQSLSFLKDNTLWIISPLGVMKRNFIFHDKSIEIETKIYSFLKFVNLYLFDLKTKQKSGSQLTLENVEVESKNNLELTGYEYSTDGKLKLFEDKSKNSYIKFLFK